MLTFFVRPSLDIIWERNFFSNLSCKAKVTTEETDPDTGEVGASFIHGIVLF